MPEGKNRQERDLPSRARGRVPIQPNPQSLTSRERKKIAKLMRHLPGGSSKRIAARHKQGGSNRGKDLMSDAERAQILRNTQSQQPKKTKNRRGVVIKADSTAVRGRRYPKSELIKSTNLRRHNKKRK